MSFFKLNNNQLTRIFSVDDLAFKKWNNEKHLNKDLLPEFRKEALASILQSLFINRNWQAEGASFPLQAVKESIEKRFQLPLYNESSLVAGIYNSFKEFKNNQPSITNVLFKKKGNKIEILDASGKQLEPEKYWGICYERKRYIIFRGELCELLPSDKSFRFLSYSQTSDLAGRASYGEYAQQTGLYPAMMIKNSHKEVSRHYFYLNMDEEEIYLEEVFGKSTLKRLQKDLLK